MLKQFSSFLSNLTLITSRTVHFCTENFHVNIFHNNSTETVSFQLFLTHSLTVILKLNLFIYIGRKSKNIGKCRLCTVNSSSAAACTALDCHCFPRILNRDFKHPCCFQWFSELHRVRVCVSDSYMPQNTWSVLTGSFYHIALWFVRQKYIKFLTKSKMISYQISSVPACLATN